MQNRKKLILSLIALFAANILLILAMKSVPDAQAATFRQGSKGDVVRQIQTKLQNWGFYEAAIDGDYGPKTADAVTRFQRKNDLHSDGIAGTRTLQALGIYLPVSNTNSEQRDNDAELLARLIYAEAKGEPYSAQVAIGAVVLNRMRHPSFPNTMSGVIFQPGAFAEAGKLEKIAAESAKKAALDAISGIDPGFGSLYYYNPRSETNHKMYMRETVLDIGSYRFCL